MSAVNSSEIPAIRSFMSDFWEKLVKTFWNPENNDDYWEDLIAMANNLSAKYAGDDFCQGMILSFLDYEEWKHNVNNKNYNKPFRTYLYERMGRKES